MRRVAPQWAKALAGLALAGWTVALTASVMWELTLLQRQALDLASFQAEGAFDRDLSYLSWNARLGGVYADADRIAPNPYLKVEHRDLDTAAGRLTMVSPSYMTRLAHGISAEVTGVISHITSLNPIRPQNAPSEWEAAALRAFEDGSAEVRQLDHTPDGAEVLRFMRPLIVSEPCLKCHAQQGYAVGDVRGGISVSIPLAPIAAILAPPRQGTILAHLGVWFLGALGIGLGARKMTRLNERVEAAREAAQAACRRAEATDRAKSQFLASMSHELRTPLNAILGFSELMEQKTFGPLGHPQYAGYIGDIRTSGEHLLSLVNDVLDLSKIEAGRMTLEERVVPLETIVREVAGLMQAEAARSGLLMRVDIAPELPDLRGDARAIRQMLLNLIGNAVKFTPDGGRIRVAATLRPDGGQDLSVKDSGCGMSQADLDHVMEPFFQAAGPIMPDRPGTGLGLALVKGFMDLHGGTIILDSQPGRGTTVTLRFPPDRTIPTKTDRVRSDLQTALP